MGTKTLKLEGVSLKVVAVATTGVDRLPSGMEGIKIKREKGKEPLAYIDCEIGGDGKVEPVEQKLLRENYGLDLRPRPECRYILNVLRRTSVRDQTTTLVLGPDSKLFPPFYRTEERGIEIYAGERLYILKINADGGVLIKYIGLSYRLGVPYLSSPLDVFGQFLPLNQGEEAVKPVLDRRYHHLLPLLLKVYQLLGGEAEITYEMISGEEAEEGEIIDFKKARRARNR